LHFFTKFAKELKIRSIIGLDNFQLGEVPWLKKMQKDCSDILQVSPFNIIRDRIERVEGADQADCVIHMASIASPTFYRKYPIETVDANIWGLRNLLEFYKNLHIRGLLFFSSSEIYGDPLPEFIPTHEEYKGNVATMGPRACYDEAKRFGETLCYLFSREYGIPIRIARPFNNYGPGMRLDDKRVPADFASAVFENRDIEIFSDGSPTRTFCYIADAVVGYLRVITHDRFDCFNIGIEKPEISIKNLATIYQKAGEELFQYRGQVRLSPPPEREYLTDNPNRRCPSIEKARTLLGYDPTIDVSVGVRRFLEFIKTGNDVL
jgi:UDP-glucuronate decarboxylase